MAKCSCMNTGVPPRQDVLGKLRINMPRQVRQRASCLNPGVLQEGTSSRRCSCNIFTRNEKEGFVHRVLGLTRPKKKQDLITVVTLLSWVTGGRGRFHNEELHIFYCFPDFFIFLK